ncbi:phasin family protein [Roseomonas marmotae]|uniref:Phasin family protein n=1 Tax=Roseomonas marmotae TaxID=2768161 RepID=A0ABS3KH72_9PROT|nr:phasin family protein [Roseomonas marmotae]MBO1076809.1 phasin family protein [Roseomonas marmotae]QTI78727.1 phasin family protein [Roseomonas marmotae]
MSGTTNVTKLTGEAAKLTARTVRKVADQNAAQVEKTLKTSPAKTDTALEQIPPMDQITQTTDNLYKSAEDAVEFNRGNLEAFTKATQTYMTGLQDLSRQAFALAQGMGEQAVENAKALATVKSLKEATELNGTFMRSAMEKSVSETTKLNEAAFKLAEQTTAPLAARWTMALEKFAKPSFRV